MQNLLFTLVAVVVLVGIGYALLMSTDTTPEVAVDVTPAMDDTVATDEVIEPDMTDPMEVNPTEPMMPNIVETAVASEDFDTLVTGVTAAGLAPVLAGEGPFTVFAPTDAAFADLPDGTLESLLQPENQADLAGILTYHVVPGAVSASDLSDGMTVETVNGETVTFTVDAAGGVMVNGATVVTADIETSNGIIHVIDTVLLPSTE